jgi:hypothetical protein
MRTDIVSGADFCRDELAALRRYKERSEELNLALRKQENMDSWKSELDLLDRGIRKQRLTQPVRLYRATSKEYLPEIGSDGVFNDLAYASTARTNLERGTHFRHSTANPLLLVIDCPQGAMMAFLEFHDSGQSEDELLLPRGSRFQVWATKRIGEQRKMLKATRANKFHAQDWETLHVYYTRLLVEDS